MKTEFILCLALVLGGGLLALLFDLIINLHANFFWMDSTSILRRIRTLWKVHVIILRFTNCKNWEMRN
ncbi:MAG: hypothetical protein ACREE6_03835 [Limisphaerales bacterium]